MPITKVLVKYAIGKDQQCRKQEAIVTRMQRTLIT